MPRSYKQRYTSCSSGLPWGTQLIPAFIYAHISWVVVAEFLLSGAGFSVRYTSHHWEFYPFRNGKKSCSISLFCVCLELHFFCRYIPAHDAARETSNSGAFDRYAVVEVHVYTSNLFSRLSVWCGISWIRFNSYPLAGRRYLSRTYVALATSCFCQRYVMITKRRTVERNKKKSKIRIKHGGKNVARVSTHTYLSRERE